MNLALSMLETSSMAFFMDREESWTGKALKLRVSSLTAEPTGSGGSITRVGT
jgi:hypothetical protein